MLLRSALGFRQTDSIDQNRLTFTSSEIVSSELGPGVVTFVPSSMRVSSLILFSTVLRRFSRLSRRSVIGFGAADRVCVGRTGGDT